MKNICICDSSLADFNSTFSFKEKLEIAKRLSNLGVDIIEMPTAKDKTDEVLIKTVATCVVNSTVSYLSKLDVSDVKKGISLLNSAKKSRLNISVPVSPALMEYQVGKKPKVVLENLRECVKYATENGQETEITLQDFSRAEKDFVLEIINCAKEFGVNDITFSDITGSMLPSEFVSLIDDIVTSSDISDKVNLGIAVSDKFGMAVSTCLSALKNKISLIKTGIFGKDLPSLVEITEAVFNIGTRLGFSTRIDRTGICRVVEQIKNLCDNKDGATKPVSGEKIELKEKMTESELSETAIKLGYDLSQDDVKKVYAEYLRLSEKKEVNVKELEVIIATSAMQVRETYSLVSFSVNSSNVLTATASITLKKGDKILSGLSYGNGAVDAAFLAIENIIGKHYELDDFVLGAVTEGKEAMGQAIVKLRSDGVIYSGRGVSTDIVGAGIRAYVSAINKIVYEENER